MHEILIDQSRQSVSHHEERMLEYNEAVINLRDKYIEKFVQLVAQMESEVEPLHGEDARHFEDLAALVISNVEDTITGIGQ